MAQGGTQWGPGNFGFLDQAGNGADSVAHALASDTLFSNCQSTSTVTTETGNILNAVRDSLNLRFDFSANSASACKDPPCSPSTNVVKDVVKPAGSCGWLVPNQTDADVTSNNTPPRYFPRTNGNLPNTVTPQTMGYPRDTCHYFLTPGTSGTYTLCANKRVGDGNWDRAAYFRTNHPGLDYVNTEGLGANVTRYQTYLWEAADVTPSRLPANKTIAGNTQYAAPQCRPPGEAPVLGGADRRRITAAVINCHATPALNTGKPLNGKKDLVVAGYIDVFLVQPSIDRQRCNDNKSPCRGNDTFALGGVNYLNAYGSNNDIYVEVIGASGTGEGGGVPQVSRRDVPRLIE
jgi:hypothetical protein